MTRLFAYIDPGNGSIIIQAIVGAVAGVAYTIRHRIRMIIGKFRKGKKTDTKPKDK